MLASTSICFDLSVFELFVPLSSGGTVYLTENALALPSLPAASQVTLINSVPSALGELLRQQCVPPSVRVVNLREGPRTPCEADIRSYPVFVKSMICTAPPDTTYSTGRTAFANRPRPIGKPIEMNRSISSMQDNQNLMPVGVAGRELSIGGFGLARG